MGGSLTNIKRKRVGHPKDRKGLKYLFALLLFCLVAASAYVVIRSEFSKEKPEVTDEPDSYVIPGKLTDPEHFKKAYIEANGGLEHLQSLQTLRINGRILKEGQEFDFVVLKRRPDMMLMTQKFGRTKVTYGSKDGEYWKRKSFPGQKETVEDASEDQIAALTDTVKMFGPVLEACLKGTGNIESIEHSEWEERKVLRVRVSSPGATASDSFYVDPDRLVVIAQVAKEPEGKSLVSEFSNYKKIDGVDVPFTTIMKQGDDVLSRVMLEDVRFNVGASSIIFER